MVVVMVVVTGGVAELSTVWLVGKVVTVAVGIAMIS